MSIEFPSNLLEYHAFIKSTLSKGGSIDEDATPAAFLEYQNQLNRLRASLQPAAERFKQGDEGTELDIDQLVEEALSDGLQPGEQV
jgi:hypothetical protein